MSEAESGVAGAEFLVRDPEAMESAGERIGGALRAGDVVVLTGPLGAGKTTFTRGLGRALGVRGPVTSPTFVIARTHPAVDGPDLVHVDAYRLGGADELADLDLDLEASVVVIEWGAGLVAALSDRWLEIEFVRPMGAAVAPDLASDAEPVAADDVADDAEPVEPRRLVLRPVGPGWQNVGW